MKRLLPVVLLVAVGCAPVFKVNEKKLKLEYVNGNYSALERDASILAQKGFPQGYFYLGVVYYKKGNRKKAEELFRKAAEEDPKFVRKVALFYYRERDYRRALYWLKRALQMGNRDLAYQLLRTEFELGVLTPSEIEKFSRLLGNNPRFYLLAAKYFKTKKEYEKALHYYRLAYRLDPKAGFGLAKVLLLMGKEEEALKVYRELLQKGYREAALEIGKIYERRARRIKESCVIGNLTPREYFMRKLKVSAEKRQLLKKALEYYKLAGDIPEARYRALRVEWLLKGESPCQHLDEVRRFKNVPIALKDLKRCSVRLTGEKKVKEKENLRPEEGTALYYYLEGVKYINYAPEKAEKLLQKACQLGYQKAEIKLAVLSIEKNPQLAGAIFYYYAQKGNLDAMYHLALLYRMAGETGKYLYWLRKAADRGYTPAIRELVRYYISVGKVDEAVSLLEKFASRGYCFALVTLGRIYEGEALNPEYIDVDRAIHYYEEAIKRKCPEAYFRLAYLYYFLGEYEKSRRLVEEYLKFSPEPKAYVLLYRVCMKLNDLKCAARALKRAMLYGFRPPVYDMATLSRYINFKKLYRVVPKPVKARILYYYGVQDRNFYSKLCKIVISGEMGEELAPSAVVRSVTNDYSVKHRLFFKKVANNPGVCRKVVRRAGF